jgi:hypothetical protein
MNVNQPRDAEMQKTGEQITPLGLCNAISENFVFLRELSALGSGTGVPPVCFRKAARRAQKLTGETPVPLLGPRLRRAKALPFKSVQCQL